MKNSPPPADSSTARSIPPLTESMEPPAFPPVAPLPPPITSVPPSSQIRSKTALDFPPPNFATSLDLNTLQEKATTSGKGPEQSREHEESPATAHWFTTWMWDAPSWLVSTLVHVAIILLLALIPLRDEVQQSLSLILGMSGGGSDANELTAFNISESDSLDEISMSDVGLDLSLDISELSPTAVDLPSFDSSISVSKIAVRGGLSSRSGLMKGALLKAYGGTAETERAVALGLEWLKRNQTSDGSWSLAGPYGDAGVSENRSAATALALMAFMGAGSTHQSGEYKNTVASGLSYLLSIQNDEGFFAAKSVGIQKTYSQAQASIALCELYGMTGDEALRRPAEIAVKYALAAQSDGGGWRYNPREAGDTSVTGWYVMALISARMAGLDVDSEALERIHRFLDTVQRSPGVRGPSPDGELYSYLPSNQPKDSMTAEGMLCRMYLGWSTTDPRIEKGCTFVADRPITGEIAGRDYYYWYYATNALHHAGGKSWTRWNNVMRDTLPALQIQTGRERGSWPPQGDPHGDAGGRLYSTALAILCLEAYYRHMPLSEMAPPKK